MELEANISDGNITGDEKGPLDVRLSPYVFALHVLIVLVGVPGNVLILVVYWAKPRRQSTPLFIMTLAAADLMACLARFCEVVQQGITLSGTQPPNQLYAAITVMNNISVAIAAAVTAIIALDRYDCICRQKKNRLLNHRRSCWIVAITCFVTLLINIPLFAFLSGIPSLLVVVFLRQAAFYFIDVLVVLICYGKVFITIRRHVKVGVSSLSATPSYNSSARDNSHSSSRATGAGPSNTTNAELPHCSTSITQGPRVIAWTGLGENTQSRRRNITPQQEQWFGARRGRAYRPHAHRQCHSSFQRKTTRMLFLATMVFLLTYIPYWIFVGFSLSGRPHDSVHEAVGNMLHLLFLNNAINPLIYGLANRRFRVDVQGVIRKVFRRNPRV